jgi:predicted cytidylate kinase
LLITVSGPPGSGTTTAAARVAPALGLELVLGGAVFRAMAAEHAMSLAEFGIHAAARPAVDIELDRRLTERARAGRVVIESRLAGWMTHREGLDALRVYLRCDERIRAQRVAAREQTSVEKALADNAEREKVEHDRYFALYGLDIYDISVYDLVVDTGVHDAAATSDQIVAATRARFGTTPD